MLGSPSLDDLRKLEYEIGQLISSTKDKIQEIEAINVQVKAEEGEEQEQKEGEADDVQQEEVHEEVVQEDQEQEQEQVEEEEEKEEKVEEETKVGEERGEPDEDELKDEEQEQAPKEETREAESERVDDEETNYLDVEETQQDISTDERTVKQENQTDTTVSVSVTDETMPAIQVLEANDNTNESVPALATSDAEDEHSKKQQQHSINPKVEYVEAQTLPRAALGLFEDQIKGLPQTGDEFLKKKYGVASYPTNDLKDMLAGEIPHDDFTRAKPTNQVQFSTFTTFLEPYFRPYGEEDLSFLQQSAVAPIYHGQMPNPYTIPALGNLYTHVWAKEDGPDPGYTIQAPPTPPMTDVSSGSADELSDDILDTNKISCGPLVSRLLAALIPDPPNMMVTSEADTPVDDSVNGVSLSSSSSSEPKIAPTVQSIEPYKNSTAVNPEYFGLEDRLKREMRYIGVLTTPDIDWANGEDDEICLELRAAQKELRRVSSDNADRKRKLIPLVEHQMAYQEYAQILDDLDKQVDNIFMKRSRNKSKKRKGVPMPSGPEAALIDSGAVKALLDKRSRWVNKIGPCFDSKTVIRTPAESIFQDDGNNDGKD